MTKLDFPYHDLQTPNPEARQLLEKAQAAFGMVPNLLAVMASAPPLGEAYLALGEHFAASGFSLDEQHVALLTVSRANGCDYCVGVHTAIAAMAGVDDKLVHAIRDDAVIDEPRLQALRVFVQSVVVNRGWVPALQVKDFLGAGFRKTQILDVIQVVAFKTLSNYTNHLVDTRLDEAFLEARWPSSGLIAASSTEHDTAHGGLPVLPDDEADASTKALFERATRQFGLLPNIIRVMSHSSTLVNSALDLHALWQQTSFSDFEREIVVLTLARANACNYCVAVHSLVAEATGIDEATASDIRNQTTVDDPRLEQLRLLATEMVERRGWLRPITQAGFLAAGYTLTNMLEIVLAQSLMVSSTYTNHLMGVELDVAFLGYRWGEDETPKAA